MAYNLDLVEFLWQFYFPLEEFSVTDHRNLFTTQVGVNLQTNACLSSSIATNVRTNNHSLHREVSLSVRDLEECNLVSNFATALQHRPKEVLGCLSIAITAKYILNSISSKDLCPTFCPVAPIAQIRITDFPFETSFGEVKASKVGQLVSIRGRVVRVDRIRCLISGAVFWCQKCQADMFIMFEDGHFPCPPCRTKRCSNKFLDLRRSLARTEDVQSITVQEIEEDSAALGRIPRTLEVEIGGDLANKWKVSDIVEVTAIVKLKQTAAPGPTFHGVSKESAIHNIYLHASSIAAVRAQHSDAASEDPFASAADRDYSSEENTFTQSELRTFKQIANSRNCLGLLVASLCPQIYGNQLVKMGLLLGLVGGSVRVEKGLNIRRNIHILLVGDPGLGKSQLLRAACDIAPKSVFLSGCSATNAGLTVAIQRDAGKSSDVTIEAGALVLADNGICAIDELDKIEFDHHALLESMEQQSISIAKGGIATTLKSRTSVFAAANPSGGHYNKNKEVWENLKIPIALLSRFDVIYILLDNADYQRDRNIARHILNSSDVIDSRDNEFNQSQLLSSSSLMTFSQRLTAASTSIHDSSFLSSSGLVPSSILRRYIAFSSSQINPVLSKPAAKVLQKFYLKMRSETSLGISIPITTRHLESLIRLSQARAKLELRCEVTKADADDIVSLWEESLLDAFTSHSGAISGFDNGILGKKGSLNKQIGLLYSALSSESRRRGNSMFTKDDILQFHSRMKLSTDVDILLDSMRQKCLILLKGPRLYQIQTN